MRRRRGDDAAPTALLHAGHGSADGMEGGGEVDRDDRVPLLDRKLLDWRDVLDTGIVDEDVDATSVFSATETRSAISFGFAMSAGE